jgi:hypothetical protein
MRSWRIRESSTSLVITESKDDIKKSEDRKKIDHDGEGGMHDVRMGRCR